MDAGATLKFPRARRGGSVHQIHQIYDFHCGSDQDSNKDKAVHKIFVGRITENLTKEDIKVVLSIKSSFQDLTVPFSGSFRNLWDSD